MFTAFLLIGAAFDLMIALFLLIVVGWILDSWHDPRDPWAGPIVTSCWLIAFLLSAGAPIVAYRLRRRSAAPGRVALAVWMPAVLLVGVCIVGLMLFPP
jgi:hypothetical protein